MVSTRAYRSSAQARQVVESWPPLKRTRAESVCIIVYLVSGCQGRTSRCDVLPWHPVVNQLLISWSQGRTSPCDVQRWHQCVKVADDPVRCLSIFRMEHHGFRTTTNFGTDRFGRVLAADQRAFVRARPGSAV